MSTSLSKKENNKLFKQRLQRIHAATGISFSLLIYISIFFGIFAILLPFIQVWEKPSRYYELADITKINYSKMIDPIISDPDFPRNNIIIELPGHMNDPALRISHQFTKTFIFNPNTNTQVINEAEQSKLASFLNHMHYGRELKTVGYIIFGFVAVAGMFLTLGGLIQVLIIKYKNTGKNAQSNFSKWHRKIFTFLFLPFLLITLTGALMNIGYSGAAPMAYIASKGKTLDIFEVSGPILFPPLRIIKKQNDTVQMLPINELIKKAKMINPNINFQKLTLINWKDSTARIKLDGYNPFKPFLNGISNKPSVILSAVDASLVKSTTVMDKHWTGIFFDALYFLHLLFGLDVISRIFMAFIMSAMALGIGFAVLLSLQKKAKKFPKEIPVYNWLGKLSLATMVGVIPATALLFFLQWILPFDLEDRFLIQKGCFYILWLATLTWSFYRINSYEAAKEFLKLAGVLFFISPLLHFYNSGFSPLSLWNQNMLNILAVDIALFVFGIILFYIGCKIPMKRSEIENFWNKRIK